MILLLLTPDVGWLLQQPGVEDGDWDLLGSGSLPTPPRTEREARRCAHGLHLGVPRDAQLERDGEGWRLSWPAPAEARRATSVWLSPAEIAAADEHRAAGGLRSRGEALRARAFPASLPTRVLDEATAGRPYVALLREASAADLDALRVVMGSVREAVEAEILRRGGE